MAGLSATQRTLRALKQRGCLCGIVERFNQHVGPFGIRQDLFGFIDIIALYPNSIVGIQSCGQSFSAHHQKIMENEIAPEWLMTGGGIELWGWRKLKKILKDGKKGKAMEWVPRLMIYSLDEDGNLEGKEMK